MGLLRKARDGEALTAVEIKEVAAAHDDAAKALALAADEIERLRRGLEDIRDYKGYRHPAHFRRRASVILANT